MFSTCIPLFSNHETSILKMISSSSLLFIFYNIIIQRHLYCKDFLVNDFVLLLQIHYIFLFAFSFNFFLSISSPTSFSLYLSNTQSLSLSHELSDNLLDHSVVHRYTASIQTLVQSCYLSTPFCSYRNKLRHTRKRKI